MRISVKRKLLIAALVLLLAAVALIALLLYCNRYIEVPRNMRVVNLDSSRVNVSLTLPEGHMFELLMEVPGKRCRHGEPPPFDFDGQCEIRSGEALLKAFPLSSRTAPECNWLHEVAGSSAYLLAWDKSSSHYFIRGLLHGGQRYSISMDFEVAPRADTSLWLSWLQYGNEVPRGQAAKARERAEMALTTH